MEMKRHERKEDFFCEKMFLNPQIRQMNWPKMFRKNPFRTNYSSFFSSKVQNLIVFPIIYMIRIRFFGPGELIQKASGTVRTVVCFAKYSCWEYSRASCRALVCHLSAMCSSMAPSLPRRGPGFQLRMLRQVCIPNRLGTHCYQTDTRDFGEECRLSWDAR